MTRRNIKDDALVGLENWINEVVAQKADGHNSLIPGFIQERFHNEMRANITYHRDVAKRLTDKTDETLSKYHFLMADIYSGLICKAGPNSSKAVG